MNFLDKMPFFNNFFLDSIVLFLGIGISLALFAAIYFGGTLLVAVMKGLRDKFTKTNKESSRATQVVFFQKEPKQPTKKQ